MCYKGKTVGQSCVILGSSHPSLAVAVKQTWVTTQSRALSGLCQHLPASVRTELMEHKEAHLFVFSAAEAQVHVCWGFLWKSWISNMLVRCGTMGLGMSRLYSVHLQRVVTSFYGSSHHEDTCLRNQRYLWYIWGILCISLNSGTTCGFLWIMWFRAVVTPSPRVKWQCANLLCDVSMQKYVFQYGFGHCVYLATAVYAYWLQKAKHFRQARQNIYFPLEFSCILGIKERILQFTVPFTNCLWKGHFKGTEVHDYVIFSKAGEILSTLYLLRL